MNADLGEVELGVVARVLLPVVVERPVLVVLCGHAVVARLLAMLVP